ncbi:MAG: hypothetical protein R2795_15450 [Saprospiraceae bacterium]
MRDIDYFEPAYRFDRIEAGDSLFTLNERYFVFNYNAHKDAFAEVVIDLFLVTSSMIPLKFHIIMLIFKT